MCHVGDHLRKTHTPPSQGQWRAPIIALMALDLTYGWYLGMVKARGHGREVAGLHRSASSSKSTLTLRDCFVLSRAPYTPPQASNSCMSHRYRHLWPYNGLSAAVEHLAARPPSETAIFSIKSKIGKWIGKVPPSNDGVYGSLWCVVILRAFPRSLFFYQIGFWPQESTICVQDSSRFHETCIQRA